LGFLAFSVADMAERVMLFLNGKTYEAAYQAASLGVTAAAMGDEVMFVLSFDTLRQYVDGKLGAGDSPEHARARELGAPEPQKMVEEARQLGARVLTCDTYARICGLGPEDWAGKLEVMGLPSIWRLAQKARSMSF
jgi:predicted peroxiredoxin